MLIVNYKMVLLSSFCSVIAISCGSIVVVVAAASLVSKNVLEIISSVDAVVDGSVVVRTNFSIDRKVTN